MTELNNRKKLLSEWLIPFAVGATALMLDKLTKLWASESLSERTIKVVGDFFYLRLAHNTGAAFSLFAGLDESYRAALLLGVSVVTLIFMVYILRPIISGSIFRRSVFALIVGGALGNMHDRFATGYVVDFLDFVFFGWHYPTFNVADMCVVVGFGFLAVWMLREERGGKKDEGRLKAAPKTLSDAKLPSEKGFTLLEVMIALAILAMSLTVILESHSRSMQMTNSIKYITVATQLARYQMIEVQVEIFEKGFSAFEEKLEGNFEELGYPNFRWEAEVKKPTLAVDLLSLGLGSLFGGGEAVAGGEGGDLLGGLFGESNLGEIGSELGIAPESGMSGLMGGYFESHIREIEEAIRFVKLTIYWTEGRREKSFSVATHIVNMPGSSPRPAVVRDLSALTPEQQKAVMEMAHQSQGGGGQVGGVPGGAPPSQQKQPAPTPPGGKALWNIPGVSFP
ncbi:MAG: hypothetical protein Kow0090_04190 [Myxococcota bacterium]